MPRIFALTAAALFAAGLPAQLTISDANMVATTGALSSASHLPRSFDLETDALQIDQGFEHWWYFRVAGDPREYSLRNAGGVTSGVTGTGMHADRDFDDLDNRGLLKASTDMDIYSAGPASGVMVSRVTFTNISNAPIAIDVFGYTDVDIAGTAGNDVCIGTLDRHFVNDPSGVQIEIRGIDALHSDVAAWPTLRNTLTDNNPDILGDTLPPFSGDYTGAFQWTHALQPFEQRTFTIIIAVDTAAVVPPLVEHYGAGNGSDFEIYAQELPLQSLLAPQAFSVRMKGALPLAEYRIATGVAPWSPLPFIPGLDLWVDPFGLVGVFGGFTNSNGEAQETFSIPLTPYLTGFSAYHQCFYVDSNAPNGFAYWTPGMRTRIGKQ